MLSSLQTHLLRTIIFFKYVSVHNFYVLNKISLIAIYIPEHMYFVCILLSDTYFLGGKVLLGETKHNKIKN